MTNYVNMGGWRIYARKFDASPIREGFHYYGEYDGTQFVGPCNTADDVWQEISDIRAEIRPAYADSESHYRRTGEAFGSRPYDPAEYADELERASVIALARRLDAGALDSEACAAGPGRYEGADDLALVVALDILSMHGCADDTAGSTDETGRYLSRFGRFILQTDSQGFVSAWREDTEALAQAELDAENARYVDVDSEVID